MLEDVTNAREREALYKSIAANVRARPPKPNPITKANWKGAFTSFWLVVITSAPAAISFLLFDDARFALCISNAILLVSLFITGYFWARFTMGKPWVVGLTLLFGGTVLVALAILLGG